MQTTIILVLLTLITISIILLSGNNGKDTYIYNVGALRQDVSRQGRSVTQQYGICITDAFHYLIAVGGNVIVKYNFMGEVVQPLLGRGDQADRLYGHKFLEHNCLIMVFSDKCSAFSSVGQTLPVYSSRHANGSMNFRCG